MFENDILEFENSMLHLNFEYDQVCLEQTMNLRKIHNKVILENAIFESAVNLYVAEAKDSGGKKKNILVRLIETIKNFIVKILNKITGGKFEPKQDKKVPFDPKALIADGTKCLNNIVQALKTSPKAQAAGKAIIATSAVAGVAKAGSFIIKKYQQGPTLKEINDFMKSSKTKLTTYQNILNSDESLDEEKKVAQQYINEFGGITSRLGKVVNAIRGNSDLDSSSEYENQKSDSSNASVLNGMSTAELKKEHQRILSEINEINEHNKVFNRMKTDMHNKKDETGYSSSYTAARRTVEAKRKETLEKQLKRCEYLLNASAARDAISDDKWLQSQRKKN